MRKQVQSMLAAVLCSSLALAAGAAAQSGGVGTGGDASRGERSSGSAYAKVPFGRRNLRRGDRGNDVKTLNWLLRANRFGSRYGVRFERDTDAAVRAFQGRVGQSRNGVVKRGTRKAFARRMKRPRATWYGPGFWGNRTACGQKLRPKTIGVAHRKLPCGTKVVFAHRGRWVRARVIDRGPYRRGYSWDLTRRLAKKLGFLSQGTGRIRSRVVH